MTTEAHNSRASTSDAFRSNGMAGPNGRTLSYSFGTSGGINDYLNRVSAINDTTSGTTALASYMYLGLGTVVRITYPQPSVWLDLWGGTSGTFNGFDLFGRITDQRWQKSITGTPTDIDRYQYGYDLNSNRLYKANVVGTAAVTAGLDEFYTYDPLNRLTEMQRGVLNSGKTGITGTPSVEQDWTLDPVGNWSGFVTKASGTTTLDQTRTASKVNEITNITESTGSTWVVPAYDAAGNTVTMPQPASPTSSFTGVYDAWNRMVSISAGSTLVGKYQYDSRGFRIVKLTYTSGVLSETRHFYYTSNWQDIEERVGTSTAMDKQCVNGIRYIDELICRDDATPQRLYATQDANFNLTSIANTAGTVVERYLFDPYGNRTITNPTWSPIGSSAYDLQISFQGLFCCLPGFIYSRGRDVANSVFLARNHLGYVDRANLYQYLQSNPINLVDPTGWPASSASKNPSSPPVIQKVFCYIKGNRVFDTIPCHGYVLCDGIGYGKYAYSHRGGATDSSGGVGVIATKRSVFTGDEGIYPVVSNPSLLKDGTPYGVASPVDESVNTAALKAQLLRDVGKPMEYRVGTDDCTNYCDKIIQDNSTWGWLDRLLKLWGS